MYFGYAKDIPIFDYHCHLPEKQLIAYTHIYDTKLVSCAKTPVRTGVFTFQFCEFYKVLQWIV